MPSPQTVVVTGTSRGIGKAILQSLATTPPKVPLVIYATSRQGSQLDIKPAAKVDIKYEKLDISDPKQIHELFNTISGDVNILINNAGVNLDDNYNFDNVRTTLNTNYRGTSEMCQTFIPRMAKNARIVNVSSAGSTLQNYSKAIQAQFRESNMELKDLEDLVSGFEQCVSKGTEAQNGWPRLAYGVSKASINTLTAILARKNPELLINACCPGWVDTDMGRLTGPRPSKHADDGARIPLKLAFGDVQGISGRYWGNRSVSSTADGEVLEW